MVFSSIVFLFLFLPCVLLIHYLINTKYRNGFLTFASLFFYAWGEKKLVMLMIFSILINYLGGIVIEKSQKSNLKTSKIYLIFFVLINVSILAYFKYFNFFIENINSTGILKISRLEEVILPIGISFFTFQGISYLIDVYYKKVDSQKSLTSLALYISMFPQLIAGPIVRYFDISEQIKSNRTFNLKKFRTGIKRFAVGLFKKVIIANQMGFVADLVFNNSENVGSLSLWIGIVCYSFQIYFDFSGYSDMAIGLGKMFGFDFLENFNYPYISKSIKDFWRRWHISLSSWFKDYLYIPLGGSRKGISRTYINLVIVFFVTGLWHGASWNFIVWGLYHGLFLILEKKWIGLKLEKSNKIVKHFYTIIIVLFGWVFFRANSLEHAFQYIGGMFSFSSVDNEMTFEYLNMYFIIILIMAFVFSTRLKLQIENLISLKVPRIAVLKESAGSFIYIFLFIVCLLELAQDNYNPFIYFRF